MPPMRQDVHALARSCPQIRRHRPAMQSMQARTYPRCCRTPSTARIDLPPVRRLWAWPEIAGLAVTALGFVVSIVLA